MPVISSGQLTIVDVTDGINARLSNEAHVVSEPAAGANLDLTGANTTMSVYFGATDDSNNWQFAVTSTVGLTGQLTGQTYQVTSLPGDAGYVEITASRIGYSSITSRFTVTKARRGAAGPAIALVAGSPGFFYKDGVATPANQVISFTLIRNNATEPAVFFASDNLPLTTDKDVLQASSYVYGTPTVGNGDTAYLDISALGTRKKITVTVICGGLSASQTIVRLDESTAEAGATVGATIGVNLSGQITSSNAATFIANAAIQSAQIGELLAGNIAAGAIVAGKIAANAVTAATIEAGSITTAKVAAGAITALQIAANTIVANNIAANAITASAIETDAIITRHLSANSITATKIVADAIQTVHLSANAVTADKIIASAITTDKLAANSVTANKIVAATITGDRIAANTLTANNILANSITADRIDSRGLSIKDAAGNVIFAAGTALDPQYINLNDTKAGVSFIASANANYNGGIVRKISGTSAWDAQAYSTNYYTTCQITGKARSLTQNAMFGLNNDPATDANFTGINYAWYINAGVPRIYENGTLISTHGTLTLNTVLTVIYDGSNVAYLKDGVEVRKIAVSTGQALYADTSINNVEVNGGIVIEYGPYAAPGGQVGELGKIDQITAANASTYIANAAIQNAQIGSAAITEANIADAAITNAKIANVIQSTNYVAGSAGWRIDKAGNMELNAATFRGTIDVKNAATGARLEIKNNVIKVFDASNVLRVQLGDLTA